MECNHTNRNCRHPLAQVCQWPDREAPAHESDWDDTPLCRRPAVTKVLFNGALKGVPSCQDCADWALKEAGNTAAEVKL